MFNLFSKKKGVEVGEKETKQIIEAMVKHGSNPEKDHLVEFAFAGNWNKLNKLRDYLLSQGYEQITNQTDKMLVMSNNFKLKFDEINSPVIRMNELAKKYDVDFDGWSSYITK